MAAIQLNEMLATIANDGRLVQRNPWGDLENWTSQDIWGGVCERIEAEEDFLKAVEQSKGLAFVIERGTKGVKITKTFQAADCFYRLLSCLGHQVPDKHELGIRSHELSRSLRKCNLQDIRFTQKPREVVSEGLLEADIVNAITTCVYGDITKESVTTRTLAQCRQLQYLYAKAERLTLRLLEHHKSLTGLPFNLCYRPGKDKKPLLSQAKRHLQRFLDSLSPPIDTTGLAGYFLKREHLSELGYRHFFLGWFRSSSILPEELKNRVQEAWHDASDGRGYAEFITFDQVSPRSWGEQPFLRPESVQLEATLKAIQCLVLRDQYCRLSGGEPGKVFGFSKPPAPLPPKRPDGNHLVLKQPLTASRYAALILGEEKLSS